MNLTKTRTVFFQNGTGLDPNGNENRMIDFVTEREDCWDPAIDRRFPLPRDVWDDMGRPTEITVTVEPGDLLNKGRAESGEAS